MWAADSDVRAQHDQRRPVLDLLGLCDGRLEAVQLDVLAEVDRVPPVGLEALGHVLGERHRHVAVELDAVVVVERDQAPELEVAGERAGLRGHALLDVAVGGDRVRVVVDDLVPGPVEPRGQHALGQRHADGVRDALAQRPGRRLDPGRVAVLGVTGAG